MFLGIPMRCLGFVLLLGVCCNKSPTPAANAATNQIQTPLHHSQRIAYRFVDHAHNASLNHSDAELKELLSVWHHPYKMYNPYASTSSDKMHRVQLVALPHTEVAGYPAQNIGCDSRKPHHDAIWNSQRGVYPSKISLVGTFHTKYTFQAPSLRTGTLRFALGVMPLDPKHHKPLHVKVSLQGNPIWQQTLSPENCLGAFVEVEIPISFQKLPQAPLVFSFSAESPSHGVVVWGNPILWEDKDSIQPPNVLVVTVDTLRADALTAMPHTQAFAKRGVFFDQAVTAATWTRPSLLALFGASMPTSLGQSAEDILLPDADRQIFYNQRLMLLPHIFKQHDFYTKAIGNNFFLLGYSQIGLDMGFEEVDDIRHPVLDTPAITRGAIQFLQQQKNHPFFLYVHYDAPHWPYTPPKEFLNRIPPQKDAAWRKYLAEAAYTDDQLGHVFAALDQLHLSERTVVVVMGDHGEIFDPAHNHFVVQQQQPTLYHHGWSAYDEILHIPLLMAGPGLPSQKVITTQVRSIDVAPTLLELLAYPKEILGKKEKIQGIGLLPLLKKPTDSSERMAFVEGQNVQALRTPAWLYLHRMDGRLKKAVGWQATEPVYTKAEELYHTTMDPNQHVNLVEDPRPQIQNQLQTMRTLFQKLKPVAPQPPMGTLHLAWLAPNQQEQTIHGILRTHSPIHILTTNQAYATTTQNQLDFTLRSGEQLVLQVPLHTPLSWRIQKEKTVLKAECFLLGGEGLPLLPKTDSDWIQMDTLARSHAKTNKTPFFGTQGGLFLWEDATNFQNVTLPSSSNPHTGVDKMMRSWGYAH